MEDVQESFIVPQASQFVSPCRFPTYHKYPSIDPPKWIFNTQVATAVVGLLYLSWAVQRPYVWMQYLLACCVLLGMLIPSRWWTVRASRQGSRLSSESQPQPSLGKGHPRLICYGSPRELSDLVLDLRFREPIIAAMKPLRIMKWAMAGLFVGGPIVAGFESGLALHPLLTGFFYAGAGSCVFLLPVWWPWKKHYRVTPQRLDVLQGRLWRMQSVCERRIPLQDATVICHFEEQKLYIRQPGAETEEPYTIELQGLAEPHAFVKAVFEAAASPHLAPPLPDEEFLG